MEGIKLEDLICVYGCKEPDRGRAGEVSFSELNDSGRMIQLKNHRDFTFVFSPLDFSTIPTIHIGDYLSGYYSVRDRKEKDNINRVIAYQLLDKEGGIVLERGCAKGYCFKK